MKRRYLFVLGRQSDIALAELTSVLKLTSLQYRPDRIGSHEFVVETDGQIEDPQALLNRLGGVIKIAELDDRLPLDRPDEFGQPVSELLKGDVLMRTYMPPEGRWTFGFSTYAPDFTTTARGQLKDWLHKIGIKAKSDAKSRKRSARFVAARGNDLALTSVVVRGNKLLPPSGTDIIVLIHGRQVERGRTIAVQDFEAYGTRDYGRPARDPKVGSLPPKLAQAMVNLAEVKPGGRIHDPFVGTGTVIQEALLLGYTASGSDIEDTMVQKSKANIDWLRSQYRPGLPDAKLEAAAADKFQADERTLDAIVTEGTLGPTHGKPFSPADAATAAAEISAIWRATLKHVRPLLKPDAKVVLTWPVFSTTEGKEVAVSLLDELPGLGYRATDLLAGSSTSRSSLRYERPGQVVRRQLYRLTLA